MKPRQKVWGTYSDYTPDELEFAKALDLYKRQNQRPFPTCSEVLGVLVSLGYRKVALALAPKETDGEKT